MSDVRDVFFQLDPFEALPVGSGLGVAVEPAHLTIGSYNPRPVPPSLPPSRNHSLHSFPHISPPSSLFLFHALALAPTHSQHIHSCARIHLRVSSPRSLSHSPRTHPLTHTSAHPRIHSRVSPRVAPTPPSSHTLVSIACDSPPSSPPSVFWLSFPRLFLGLFWHYYIGLF